MRPRNTMCGVNCSNSGCRRRQRRRDSGAFEDAQRRTSRKSNRRSNANIKRRPEDGRGPRCRGTRRMRGTNLDAHKRQGRRHPSPRVNRTTPAMNFAASDAFRQRLYLAFNTRAHPQISSNWRGCCARAMDIAFRARIQIVGRLQRGHKMIGNGARIAEFSRISIRRCVRWPNGNFKCCLAERESLTRGEHHRPAGEKLLPRAGAPLEEFNFDSQSVRPYFPYTRVKQGILDTRPPYSMSPFGRAWRPRLGSFGRDLASDRRRQGHRTLLFGHAPAPGQILHAEMMLCSMASAASSWPEGF